MSYRLYQFGSWRSRIGLEVCPGQTGSVAVVSRAQHRIHSGLCPLKQNSSFFQPSLGFYENPLWVFYKNPLFKDSGGLGGLLPQGSNLRRFPWDPGFWGFIAFRVSRCYDGKLRERWRGREGAVLSHPTRYGASQNMFPEAPRSFHDPLLKIAVLHGPSRSFTRKRTVAPVDSPLRVRTQASTDVIEIRNIGLFQE